MPTTTLGYGAFPYASEKITAGRRHHHREILGDFSWRLRLARISLLPCALGFHFVSFS
jgi:hypothetical protein